MSTLAVYAQKGGAPEQVVTDYNAVAAALKDLGVRFERWQADRPLTRDAGQDEVLAVYQESVDRLNKEYGFKSVDVIALRPDHPKREELRAKFLDEHTHADFEVRFFVDGKGLFFLHVGEKVYAVMCEQGDLISVPANTPHWFDMGVAPDFKCIRLFVIPDGWVAEMTNNDIAKHFPTFDQFAETYP